MALECHTDREEHARVRTERSSRTLTIKQSKYAIGQRTQEGMCGLPARRLSVLAVERASGPRGAREDRLGDQPRVIEHRNVPDVVEHDEVRSRNQLTRT